MKNHRKFEKRKYDTNQPTIIWQHSQRTEYHLQPMQQYIFASIQLQPEEMNAEHVELQNRENRVVCIKENAKNSIRIAPTSTLLMTGEVLVFRGTPLIY